MMSDAKARWDSVKAELSIPPSATDPERGERIERAMEPAYALLKAFERGRDHHPFVSEAPCPICEIGIVKYWRKAPLIGQMACNTPECISLNL